MCRHNPAIAVTKHDETARGRSVLAKLWGKVWPLPVPVVVALIPLLPQSFYLNRGYTVWFHLTSIAFLLTRSSFLRRVLILQGTAICGGWYCAIANDWVVDGTFCHSLYRNMPSAVVQYILRELPEEGSYEMFDGGDGSVVAAKVLSHVLDTIGHPVLAYFFWKLHRQSGGTLDDILTWPVIVFAWHLSRTWSLLHSYHNNGAPSFWYYGHDVYMLRNLDCYLVAYVVEGFCFGAAILCRLYWDGLDRSQSPSKALSPVPQYVKESYYGGVVDDEIDAKPALIHSESAMSTSSMIRE